LFVWKDGTISTEDRTKEVKRGIAFWKAQSCNTLENHKGVSWWYSWRIATGFTNSFCGEANVAYKHALDDLEMEFVPMLWGDVPLQPFDEETDFILQTAFYLLTFNEPEREDQANLSAERAAQLWPQVEGIASHYNLKIVAPCGTVDEGKQWYTEWLENCRKFNGKPCRYDYTCLHSYYQPYPCKGVVDWACIGADGSRAMDSIDDWFNKFGKPIWVTEIGCNPWGGVDCNAEIHQELMEQLVPLLELSKNVFRYAWYSANANWFGNSNTNEMIWELTRYKDCTNKKFLGKKSSNNYECMITADQDSECFSPLVLILAKGKCYCAKDACSNPIAISMGNSHIYRESSARDNNALTSLGQVYQTITPPICTDDANWELNRKKKSNCAWVRKQNVRRCEKIATNGVKAKDACPVACQSSKCSVPICRKNSDWEVIVDGNRKNCNFLKWQQNQRCQLLGSDGIFGYEACEYCGYCTLG